MAASAAGALAALALAAGGCSSEDTAEGGAPPGPGDLEWAKPPRVVAPDNLPRDRILSGKVRNGSLEPVELSASDLRVVDEAGEPLESSATFAAGFVHSLYPPTREPELSDEELRRLGRKALIEPDGTVPLTVSWRRPAGAEPAARVDYGVGSLPIR